jgi:hypothetical protein
MDNSDNLGIRIQEFNLSKVSGPVGISLIVPKENIVAPILLILGEEHIEIKNSCPDINPNDQITQLFDKLNTISTRDNFDMHFYAEMFLNKTISNNIKFSQDDTYINKHFDSDYDTNKKFTPIGLLDIISTPYKACYYNEIQKKNPSLFNKKCKYPNIKWQYNDIRSTLHNDKITIANISLLQYAVGNLIVYLSSLSNFYREQFVEKTIKEMDRKISMKNKMKLSVSNDIKNRDELLNPTLDISIKNFFIMIGLEKGKIKHQQINIADEENDENSVNTLFVDFVNALKLVPLFYLRDFDTIIDKLLETDILKKQIKKQHIGSIKSSFNRYLTYWYDRLYTNPIYKKVNDYVINLLFLIIDFFENINDDDITGDDVIYRESIHDKFKSILEYINLNNNIDDYFNKDADNPIMYGGIPPPGDYSVHKKYRQICELINLETFIKPYSIILDMYFILRVFKYEITKPTLICCVIGNAHKTNIAEYFKITGNYNVFNFKRMSKTLNTPLYQCVDTINNVTINDKIMHNFSIDLYDLLKFQESLIFQKLHPSEENDIHMLSDGSYPTEETEVFLAEGYKENKTYKSKINKNKTNKSKINKNKTNKNKINKNKTNKNKIKKSKKIRTK